MSEFVEGLFEEDLHLKRVMSLANATTGVLRSASLGIHAIGRGLAVARPEISSKHAVKQVDRLLSNDGIDVQELLSCWVPFAIADRTEIWIALDWTEFRLDRQATVVASLVTSHGRATPLAWMSVEDDELNGRRIFWEEKLLERLRLVLPKSVTKAVVIADRGFADSGRWSSIQRLGFDFIVRIRGTMRVSDADGNERIALDWVQQGGRTRALKEPKITVDQIPVASFVAVKKPDMKDEWCLVTSVPALSGAEVIKMYGKRFTIEESFRDIKDLRFGMGLSSMRIRSPKRRDRLLLLSALAIALLTLLGAAGEAAGIDRHFKSNTSKKRQLSLFRQGCLYYEFLPNMREAWATPLITQFEELLSKHEIFEKTLGFI